MAINDPNVYKGHYDMFDCSSPCCFNCRLSQDVVLLNGEIALICDDKMIEVSMDSVCDGFRCAIDRRKVESINKWLRQNYEDS